MKKLLALGLLLFLSVPAFAQPGPPVSGGTPGGSTPQCQYNNAGVFAGNSACIFYDTAIATPGSGPTVVVNGTAGAQTVGYVYAGVGQLGQGPSSPMTSITNSQTSGLSMTNFNAVTTAAVTGATTCNVFRVNNTSQPGFATFLANVTCGATYNDTAISFGAKAATNGNTGNNPFDSSAGMQIGTNLVVKGGIAVGSGALNAPIENTASQVGINVGIVDTGGSTVSSDPDPAGVAVKMTAAPTVAGSINQMWAGQFLSQTLTTNANYVNALEGFYAQANCQGSGQIDGCDAIYGGVSVAGSVGPSSGGNRLGRYTGINLSNASSTSAAIPQLIGAYMTMIASGSGGIASMADFDASANAGALGPVTTWYRFYAEVPSFISGGDPTTYASFHSDDVTPMNTGGTTAYGIDILGATAKNRILGQLQFGYLVSTGTKFTTSGCSISSTTGGPTAGKMTSGTSGTCTITITLGGATGATAPTGWAAAVNNETTALNTMRVSASTQTTVTLTGTTTSGDVVDFTATAY